MSGGSTADPLDLEVSAAIDRLAKGEATSARAREAMAAGGAKARKKKSHRSDTDGAALSTPATENVEHADMSDFSDTDSEPGTDWESDFSDGDADPKHKRVALDPKRIVLHEIDQRGAFTLPAEHAEYIRQQLSIEQPDDIVQRIVLEKLPVPENVQQPPRLDEYFRDLLAQQSMGHVRGTDTTLHRMQDNVRNILGPLTAAWTGLEAEKPDIEKMRQYTEKAIILVRKSFHDLTTMRRFQLIDAFKKSAARTKRLMSRVHCRKTTTLFGQGFEKRLIKMTKSGCPTKAVAKALRETPTKPNPPPRQWNEKPAWRDSKPAWRDQKPWQENKYRVNKSRGGQRGKRGFRGRGR